MLYSYLIAYKDLKPEKNILIGKGGFAMQCNFGLSGILYPSDSFNKTYSLCSSEHCFSPEIIVNNSNDQRLETAEKGGLRKNQENRLGRNKGYKEIRVMKYFCEIDIERIEKNKMVWFLLRMNTMKTKSNFELMQLSKLKEELFVAEKQEREMFKSYKINIK